MKPNNGAGLVMPMLILLAAALLPAPAAAKIVYKTVETEGYGANVNEAVNDALTQAISQVSGQAFEAKEATKLLSKTSTQNGQSSDSISEEFRSQISERTKGVIRSYEILDKTKSGGEVVVKIRATIADYQMGKGTQRLRIAVFPLRVAGTGSGGPPGSPTSNSKLFVINGKAVDPQRMELLINQALVSSLVQTRKFTILDRDYLAETLGEQAYLASGDVPITETAKLGQKLGADYILVGTLERMSTRVNERKTRTTDQVIQTRSGNVALSYRIIDVASGMVKFSDMYRRQLGDNELAAGSAADTKIASITGKEVGEKILFAIYPILIESIDGKQVTVGQGGNLIQVGDRFAILERGKKIVDSYTKESLGRSERKVGTLEIIRVGAKASTGKIIESKVDLAKGFAPRRYALKPLSKRSRGRAPTVTDVKKSIQKEREARDKKYESDW
jgi:TolB-like protein